MAAIAQIIHDGGGLVVPARDGYDRELAFEHAEFYARRYGKARIELNRRSICVHVNGTSGDACGDCGQVLTSLTYELGARTLCPRCVRKAG